MLLNLIWFDLIWFDSLRTIHRKECWSPHTWSPDSGKSAPMRWNSRGLRVKCVTCEKQTSTFFLFWWGDPAFKRCGVKCCWAFNKKRKRKWLDDDDGICLPAHRSAFILGNLWSSQETCRKYGSDSLLDMMEFSVSRERSSAFSKHLKVEIWKI